MKEYHKKNRDKIINRVSEWGKKNPELVRKYKKRWNDLYGNEYARNRRKTDPNFKLGAYLRNRINKAIENNQKSGSAVRDLGCSISELKEYLESLFQEGMSWENHRPSGWHIDHIIPLSSFNLKDREQFLKACHYTNLQPLWVKDNLKKNARVEC
jgi:hypothetical protein